MPFRAHVQFKQENIYISTLLFVKFLCLVFVADDNYLFASHFTIKHLLQN